MTPRCPGPARTGSAANGPPAAGVAGGGGGGGGEGKGDEDVTGLDPLRPSDGSDRRGQSPRTRAVGERPAPPAPSRPRGRWRPVSRRRLARTGAAAVPLLAGQWSEALARTSPLGGGPLRGPRPSRRAGLAIGGELGTAARRGRGAPRRAALAARCLRRSDPAGGACSEASSPGLSGIPTAIADYPALDADLRLGRCPGRLCPSAHAVLAASAGDVAAAVRFARRTGCGSSSREAVTATRGHPPAPDSLLVWTRGMPDVALHDAFVAPRAAPGSRHPRRR